MADNFMDGFADGYRNGTIIRLRQELDEAHHTIDLWAAREKELLARVAKAEREREALKKERAQLRSKVSELEGHRLQDSKLIVLFAVMAMGLQNQVHKTYKALDATFGIEKNPARDPVPDAAAEHKIEAYKGAPVSQGQSAFYEGAEPVLRNEMIAPHVARLQENYPTRNIWSWIGDPWSRLGYPKSPEQTSRPPRA
jgi:hypothetical protein